MRERDRGVTARLVSHPRSRAPLGSAPIRCPAYHSMPANVSGTACYHFATQFGSTSRNQAGRSNTATPGVTTPIHGKHRETSVKHPLEIFSSNRFLARVIKRSGGGACPCGGGGRPSQAHEGPPPRAGDIRRSAAIDRAHFENRESPKPRIPRGEAPLASQQMAAARGLGHNAWAASVRTALGILARMYERAHDQHTEAARRASRQIVARSTP